jgi:hypothetical protein
LFNIDEDLGGCVSFIEAALVRLAWRLAEDGASLPDAARLLLAQAEYDPRRVREALHAYQSALQADPDNEVLLRAVVLLEGSLRVGGFQDAAVIDLRDRVTAPEATEQA